VKFSLSWLRDHLDIDAPLDRILDTLTRIGLEVEGVEDRGAALAPFRIAQVLSAEPHPNADRLRACRVDAGNGAVSVVCGAPNARAGMRAVFAPPGSLIPATGTVLKIAEVRGVPSEGMLLSLREMGLGEDHAGIVELPADAPVGQGYAAWAGLDDPVVEIAVTPNRGDALGVRGIARDLAAAGLGVLKPWSAEPVAGGFPSPIRWEVEWPEACPWVLGRTVRGLRNGPSPDWLRRRLESVGLRPISALVDVTNLFALDLDRPLHVFDADKVRGGRLVMRPGAAGERFLALNGKEYEVSPEDCVIADATGLQSLAGVVGGEATGCGEGTTACFIECALFDPMRTALTGRRHNVTSDARQRFERGVDPAFLPAALDAATRLIQELCGGEASEIVGAGAEPRWQRSATLRFERLRTLGGAEVPPGEAVGVLERLGFGVEEWRGDQVRVAVPSWRNDIAAPIVLDQAPGLDPARAREAAEGCAAVEAETDLVEEVLRIRGLDAVPPVSMPRAAPVPLETLTPRQSRAALARRLLAARGLLECVTFSFMDHRDAALFGPAPEALRLLNPIASDLDQLRPSPVATLALAAKRNAARGLPEAALFEIGPAFAEGGQEWVAAGLRSGPPARRWDGSQALGALDAKADALAVLTALGVAPDSLTATRDAPGFYHPGRSGVLRQGPKLVLATFGELHPGVLTALGLPGPAVAFEVFLDRVPEPKRRRRAVPDLPNLQAVRRDFAFVVGQDVSADAVLRAAKGAAKGDQRQLIAGVQLFDVYEGPGVPEGQRSLAVEVAFQPRERALTDAEIEAASAKIVAAVAKATGATLR